MLVAGSGMTGLETAEILNETGNQVTVLEMADEIAPGTWFQLVDDEMERLHPCDTSFLPGHRLLRILPGEVEVEEVRTGVHKRIRADSVVLSLGVKPEDRLAKELQQALPRVFIAGDASASGTIADAVKSANACCRCIV